MYMVCQYTRKHIWVEGTWEQSLSYWVMGQCFSSTRGGGGGEARKILEWEDNASWAQSASTWHILTLPPPLPPLPPLQCFNLWNLLSQICASTHMSAVSPSLKRLSPEIYILSKCYVQAFARPIRFWTFFLEMFFCTSRRTLCNFAVMTYGTNGGAL